MIASFWYLWCPRCRQTRTAEDFTWSVRRRASYCRKCQSAKHREWRQSASGKTAQRRAALRARTVAPHKVKARNALYHEIRMGRMAKGPCEIGPERCAGRVEAHHDDYASPLAVRWLCQHHHRIIEAVAKSCCSPLNTSAPQGPNATARHQTTPDSSTSATAGTTCAPLLPSPCANTAAPSGSER